ncbi:MAG: EAL domain-containing protein [Pseudomonadales bacterium]
MRLLIIGDEPDLLRELGDFFHRQGDIVTTAGNGEQALGRYRESAEQLDVILIDCRMPIMDDIECVKQMRQNGCAVPVVMMSGEGEVSKNCLKSYNNIEMLSKPTELSTLKKVFDRFRSELTEKQLISATSPLSLPCEKPGEPFPESIREGEAASLDSPRILVVDDDPFIRATLCETLSAEDYSTEQAADGVEALAHWRREADSPQPFDLLVVNLKMPRLDGVGVLEEIRKTDSTLPIIVLMEHADIGDAYSLLVDYQIADFLTKPLDQPERLLFTVKNALEKYKLFQVLKTINSELEQERHKLESANDQLNLQAIYDPLTGLYNRGILIEQLQHSIALAERHNDSFSLLYFDLDHFKNVNDTCGHAVGDQLLVQVSTRVGNLIRESDVLARMGGDEFVLLVEECVDSTSLTILARRIIRALSETFYLGKQTVYISCSLGIAVFPGSGTTPEELLSNADTAMYKAKEAGRNGYSFYLAQMNERARAQVEMEKDLHDALLNNQFSLHYQPQIDIELGLVVGAEALLRWEHPQKGMIPPAVFIPVAERSDLIIDIGKWVREQVMRQLVLWKEKNFPQIKVSVNVSGKEFMKREVLQHLIDLFMEYDVDQCLLELEITEGTLIESLEHDDTDYEIIQGMDVGLSIDDFGTGYCSLSYLKTLPIDTLKIDKSFIDNITTNDRDATITKTIIVMAHSLDMNVIAEGVETEEQMSFLKGSHCDEIQGYYYSRPQPVDQFEEFVLSSIHVEPAPE